MTQAVDRLLIVGVGLIGGSFAMALRSAGLVREVVGLGRTVANLEIARVRGIIDRVATDTAAAATVDAIVLATPVGACARMAEGLATHARAGTLLTDVASVKGAVVPALEDAWRRIGPVVGAHPIAGSEAAGAEAARADLFHGRRCILTPTAATDATALATVRGWWEAVGASVEIMTPETHDGILAHVSHLPHVIAYALMESTRHAQVAHHAPAAYAGTGFLDTTRIAASRAELWRDILLANPLAVASAAAAFRIAFDEIMGRLAAGDASGLEQILDGAAHARREIGGTR